MFSDSRGDVAPGSIGGLVHEDTRFVSRWELRLDGEASLAAQVGSRRLRLRGVLPDESRDTAPPRPQRRRTSPAARGRRRPRADRGLQHLVRVDQLRVAAPLRGGLRRSLRDQERRPRPQRQHRRRRGGGGHALRFRYQVSGFLAETTIRIERSEIVEGATEEVVAEARPRIDGTEVVWALELPPRCSLLTLVKVGVRVNNVTFEPVAEGFGGRQQPVEGPLSGWLERIPRFEAESALLTSVFRQSVVDLAALRITGDLLGRELRPPGSRAPVVHDALRPGHVDHVAADALGRPSGSHAARFTCSAPCRARGSTTSATRSPAGSCTKSAAAS